MHDLFMAFGFLSILVGLPALVVLIIVDLVKRKPVKKIVKAIPTVFVVGVISLVIGSNLYSKTDEYKELVEKEKLEKQTETVLNSEKETTNNIETTYKQEETTEQKQNETETTMQEITTEVATEQQTTVLTEEGYKNSCEEMYYDDFFVQEPSVGQYVKIHGFVSGEYRYSSSSMSGIIVRDIVKQYDLRKEYLGCCVMHEETKNNAIPSYYGKSVWLMFPNSSDLNIENYDDGQHVLVYGEVVQTQHGIFIIPKYMEEE